MKRILFAYPEVAPLHNNGGIGTFVFEAATLLAQSGRWEVDILADGAYSDGTRERFSEAKAIYGSRSITLHDLDRARIRTSDWGSPTPDLAASYDTRISALHGQRRYDVIEFPEWKAPGFFAVRRKVTGGAYSDTRLVLHLHGSTRDVREWHGRGSSQPDEFYAEFMEDYVKRYSDAVVSPTEFLLDPVRRLGVEGRLLQRRAYPMQPGNGVRHRDPGPLTIACCSRLELRKGQDILAHAIRRLAPTGVLSGVQVIFRGRDGVGDARDRTMSKMLHRILRDQDGWTIADAIDRDKLAAWLGEQVDICVVPSRVDNYPNVILEAARAGCLLVCSDGGGIPELLADYAIPAAVFQAGNVESLAENLQSVIARVRDGTWSREELCSRFEHERVRQAEKCVEHYEELAAMSPSLTVGTAPSRDGWPPHRKLTVRQTVQEFVASIRRSRWFSG